MEPDKQWWDHFTAHVHTVWIEPEVERRRKDGRLKDSFQISQCLIKLLEGHPPNIEFNGEIKWRVEPRNMNLSASAPAGGWVKGDVVYTHQVREIKEVEPPHINGVRVAFVFLFFVRTGYQLIFDFSPLQQNAEAGTQPPWTFGKIIADYLTEFFKEQTIQLHDNCQVELRKIGLWAAPALLPFPMTLIIKQLMEDNNAEAARRTLVEHCDTNFIGKLCSNWWSIDQFALRKPLIEECYEAHSRSQYRLSIHALLPQIEGIITDSLISHMPDPSSKPFHAVPKTKKFKDLIAQEVSDTFYFQRVISSCMDFIAEGPVYKSFTDWRAVLDNIFPNRHAVEHGRYDDNLFTEENSVKMFLLIDTLAHVLGSPKRPKSS